MSQLAGLIIGDRSATAPAGWSRTSLARIRVLKTGSAQTSRRDDDLNSRPRGLPLGRAARSRALLRVALRAPMRNARDQPSPPQQRPPNTAHGDHSPRSFIGRPPVPITVTTDVRALDERDSDRDAPRRTVSFRAGHVFT